MPIARPTAIQTVCEWIMEKRPKRVLDIGIGFGMWGFLARNYGVMWDPTLTKEKYHNWKNEITVDGIEISKDLITPLQELIYNKIYIGNMLDIIPKLGKYDLIIMGDVIEHVTKEEAISFLKIVREKGPIILTTPDYWNEGKAIMGNEHEKHKCWIKDEDFPGTPIIYHIGQQKIVIYE